MNRNTSHVLITGGSSGLGFAMARQLAHKGMVVTIIGRNADKLEKAVRSLQEIHQNISGIAADISKSDELQISFTEVIQKHKKIDFLILAAGVVHVGALEDILESDLKQDIDIDLWGTILSAKCFLPLLSENSKVLIVSSALGLLGVAGYPGYCAAKAGVINFAAVLRRELCNKKINVYVACPADIETPQYEYEFSQMPVWMRPDEKSRPTVMSPEKAATKILKKCKGKRFIITINFEVTLLLILLKFLPQRMMDYIIDKMFPTP